MILLRSESSIEESTCNETPLILKDNEDCLAEGSTTAGIKSDESIFRTHPDNRT